MLRKLCIFLVVLIAVGALSFGLFQLSAIRNFLVEIKLPEFPDWPTPRDRLNSDDQGEIYFQTYSPFDLQVILAGKKSTPTTGLGYLTFPAEVQGPIPAMIILPGSGGIKPGREHEYAEFLNANDIAALVLEYYAPRGLSAETNYLIRTGSVTEFDLITDAYAALELLSTHPKVAGDRIGVMGFSYGGMASRLAMDARIHKALAPNHLGFKAHIDIYGPCFQILKTKATNGAPLLTLRGTEDASNDLTACAARESELAAIGVTVDARIYQGAGHAWENARPRFFSEGSPYIDGCEWRYDERGVPWVNGKPLVEYGVDAPRAHRISARLASGVKLQECVKWGYLIGRDEETRQRAYDDVLGFLQRFL